MSLYTQLSAPHLSKRTVDNAECRMFSLPLYTLKKSNRVAPPWRIMPEIYDWSRWKCAHLAADSVVTLRCDGEC